MPMRSLFFISKERIEHADPTKKPQMLLMESYRKHIVTKPSKQPPQLE